MRKPSWKEIGEARRASHLASAKYERLMARRFPGEAPIAWQTGRGTRAEGYVVAHGYGQRVEVQNRVTLASYWISYGDILP